MYLYCKVQAVNSTRKVQEIKYQKGCAKQTRHDKMSYHVKSLMKGTLYCRCLNQGGPRQLVVHHYVNLECHKPGTGMAGVTSEIGKAG
jgi:hypothetical protein